MLNKLPKVVFTDIDGVWTDGSMYYLNNGIELKRFNTYDSLGILILNHLNIPIHVLTKESDDIFKYRAQKLGLKNVNYNTLNKLELAKKILKEKKIKIEETAFIGDEYPDLALLKAVGFSSCPKQSPDYVKKNVDFITPNVGGYGAFRDFIFEILKISNLKVEKILNEL